VTHGSPSSKNSPMAGRQGSIPGRSRIGWSSASVCPGQTRRRRQKRGLAHVLASCGTSVLCGPARPVRSQSAHDPRRSSLDSARAGARVRWLPCSWRSGRHPRPCRREPPGRRSRQRAGSPGMSLRGVADTAPVPPLRPSGAPASAGADGRCHDGPDGPLPPRGDRWSSEPDADPGQSPCTGLRTPHVLLPASRPRGRRGDQRDRR
jgi:hypothetical protein